MADADGTVLSEHEAPYTDPGTTGQSNQSNGAKSTVAPDDVAAGTPPGLGQGIMHSGNPTLEEAPGERAASLFDHDEARKAELESRHQ